MSEWKLRYAGHLGLRGPGAAPLFEHSAASADPLDQIDYIADLGFAGVQDLYLKLRPLEDVARLARRAAARGMAFASFNAAPLYWDKPLWSSTDEASREILSRELEQTAALAASTGSGLAICVTGLDPSRPRAAQIAGMIENLSRLAEPAQRAGVCLLVEPVAAAFMPGLLVDRLADAEAIVRAVDSPAVRLLFDIAHVQTSEGAVLPGLAACWDIIGAIQAADTPGRIDVGAGELDWPDILSEVSGRGYTGLIEIEHEPMEPGAAGEQRLLQRLRDVEAKIKINSGDPG
jgi:hydroxypyruvate isomerase